MSPFNNSFAYIISEKRSLRRSDPFQGLFWSCFLPESYQAEITLELLMSFLEGWNISPPSLPEPETLSLFELGRVKVLVSGVCDPVHEAEPSLSA